MPPNNALFIVQAVGISCNWELTAVRRSATLHVATRKYKHDSTVLEGLQGTKTSPELRIEWTQNINIYSKT